MKATSKQYAISLFESVDGKKDGEVGAVIKSFLELLVKNNDLSKAEKIIAEFVKLWNKKEGVVESEITTARKLDKASSDSLKKMVAELTGAKKVIVNEKIDEKILGGAVIRYDDQILDASLKTRLAGLKEKMVK